MIEDAEFTRPLSSEKKNTGNHVHFRRVVGICFALAFVIDGGAFLQIAPRYQIIEGIICKEIFPQAGNSSLVDTSLDFRCKHGSVQSELAYLNGIQALLDVIPSEL